MLILEEMIELRAHVKPQNHVECNILMCRVMMGSHISFFFFSPSCSKSLESIEQDGTPEYSLQTEVTWSS